MFDKAFKVGGYAVSFQGFLKVLKRTNEMLVVDHITTNTTPWVKGSPSTSTPGASEGADSKQTKILDDPISEYIQWGRAKHNPKWRPWNGEPIPYRLMTPDNWPRD